MAGIYTREQEKRKEHYQLKKDHELYAMHNFNNIVENEKLKNRIMKDDVFIGLMLSDAHLRKYIGKRNSQFILVQTERNEDLINFTEELFNNFGLNTCRYRRYHKQSNTWSINITTVSRKAFTELRNIWYENGKKIVPKYVSLNAKSLAYLFMGDGASFWNHDGLVTIEINTQGFSELENELLVSQMGKLGLSNIHIANKFIANKKYRIIRFGNSSIVNKFFDLVEPYILPCFKYKIKRARETSYIIANNKPNKKIQSGWSKGKILGKRMMK